MATVETRDLRRFGLTLGAVFGLLGSLLFWKERPAAPYFLAAAGLVLLLGLVVPRALAPVERVMRAVARAFGTTLSLVILTLCFYLILTPIGLVLRLLRQDTMGRRFAPNRTTYWVRVEPDGPGTRPDKPY